MSGELLVLAPAGVPEITAGADLAALLLERLEPRDGDILAVTSKAVAKAEGRVTRRGRDEVVADETARVVARRGPLTIARHRLGVTLAAAGVDVSNVAAGHVVPLPLDPDASARRLRSTLWERVGTNVGVLVTDTAGRPWRLGQTDLAVGAAGIAVIASFVGHQDGYGHELQVTEPAVADELAGAAELAQGKLARRPFALLRGRADLVLPPGQDGPGAAGLLRPDAEDLFGYGAREAVLRALRADPEDRPGFGAPAPPEDLLRALSEVLGPHAVHAGPDGFRVTGPEAVVRALAFAHGWALPTTDSAGVHVLQPPRP